MAITLEAFIDYLSDIGFMDVDDVHDFLDELPVNRQPQSARRLVQEMLGAEKLTEFQADTILKGKTKRLIVGNYVIMDKIGQGGMGRVYKARHRRMDRIVALKFLPFKARESPDAVRRFDREIRAAARLFHPNVVTAHDADESEGRYFLAMEYIDGKDLLELVSQQGPLPIPTAVGYILQAAEALQYAHSQKIIHLDIKPANLLLDGNGTIKVLDMGLARIDDVLGDTETAPPEALIQDGKVMGTVDYIPPERSTHPEAVDHRADIYSLGCTLYHLLTGRPPYGGNTILKRIEAHRLKPIPSLHKKCDNVPEALEAVFQRMVAKDPNDRYASMAEVISALRDSVDGPTEELGASSPARKAPPPNGGTVDSSGPRNAE